MVFREGDEPAFIVIVRVRQIRHREYCGEPNEVLKVVGKRKLR
jgi:hypothetical protein